ncbi:hypothetical protein V2G26_009628 [Clonostachys chloroleuca]
MSSTKLPSNGVTEIHDSSRSTTDEEFEDGDEFPEGGLRSWICVLGSFIGLVGSMGILNSIGTLQSYLERNQLRDYQPGQIAWIFGVFNFLTFFFGLQIGPIFDARGPRYLLLLGTAFIFGCLISLGFCTEYWHFMLSFGVAGGTGISLIFTPCISAVSHWFKNKRGLATGMAVAGGSLGGIILPLVMQDLFPKVGFAWTTRVIALMCLVCAGVACGLVASRLPKRPFSRENILPDLKIFRDQKLTLTTMSVFFIDWGTFVPLTYISSYAIAHGVDEPTAFKLIAVLNAGSFLGRWLPGYVADIIGRFNTLAITVGLCFLSTVALWLPAGDSLAMMAAYSAIFGFASGGNISLTPVCVGQLCDTKDYGRYYATSYTIVSFGTLTGIPIAGEILHRCNGDFWGLITFTSCSYAMGLICAWCVKVLHCGWKKPFAVY